MKLYRYIIILFLAFMHLSLNAQSQLIPVVATHLEPKDVGMIFSPVERVIDGNLVGDYAMFHTDWDGIPKQDVTIELFLDGKGYQLDRVRLYPRAKGQNGIIRTAELWVMSQGTYRKVMDVHQPKPLNQPINLDLEKPVKNPERVKLVVKDAFSDLGSQNRYFVSLAEMECYSMPEGEIKAENLSADAKFFLKEGTALVLGFKKSDLKKIKTPRLRQLAEQLLKGSYSTEVRYAEYQPYLNPKALGDRLRIGDGFSKYEGITGMMLPKGDNLIFVGNTAGAKVTLVQPFWTRQRVKAPILSVSDAWMDRSDWSLWKEEFPLKEGLNHIKLFQEGLVYVMYYVEDDPALHPEIPIHFITGEVNGYFDLTRGDTNSDFNRLLDSAVSPIMDMRGKHIQVAFPVDSLKSLTYGKGVELVQNFDTIVALQKRFSGWEKEGIDYPNHVLARINYHYYMFRDKDGVAYIDWAMPMVADPASIVKGDPCWGFSHELGHVLQMRPQLTWGGMTEVSNNILTLYSTTKLGNKSRISEEGKYEAARNTILDKGISYMDFPGEGKESNQYGGDGNTDVFQRLVPFWQLHLYFTEQGYPDFYADLMIAMRHQEPLGGDDSSRDYLNSKDYLNMLEFCRLACEVSKTDLTEFFERWGFFYVGTIDVQDYRGYLYHVTQEDVDRTKQAIAAMNLPKPVKDITQMED